MTPISLDAAIVMTGPSKRTWWRRMADGSVLRLESDRRGRTMIPMSAVEPLIAFRMSSMDLKCLSLADDGDAEAQDDMGQLFLSAGNHVAEKYWLELAAQQNYPDAMQCLARCYLGGDGAPPDENLAIMWLAKAAALGHPIALAQMRFLRSGLVPTSPIG